MRQIQQNISTTKKITSLKRKKGHKSAVSVISNKSGKIFIVSNVNTRKSLENINLNFRRKRSRREIANALKEAALRTNVFKGLINGKNKLQ